MEASTALESASPVSPGRVILLKGQRYRYQTFTSSSTHELKNFHQIGAFSRLNGD